MEIAKKRFGQNFISDKNLINKIINLLDPNPDHLIIEIGPGRGALTKELCKRFTKVVAIEIDRDMEIILRNEIKDENLHLLIKDVLELNLRDLVEPKFKKISLISNTPYYITSEIIFRTFGIATHLDKAVFMVQKEVAQRICAKVNENNYNNLSVATQFYSDVRYEFTVSKKLFRPEPRVDSAIISMKFKDDNLKKVNDDKGFIKFVRKLFNNKRKTILNNLYNIVNDKKKAQQILEKVEISLKLRPENVRIQEFIDIYSEVENEN